MQYLEFWIGLSLGTLIGGLVVVFVARRNHGSTLFESMLENAKLNEKNQALLTQIESLNAQTVLQFENLANRIFEDKSAKFTTQNLQGLQILLDPLREKIKDFEKKVEDTYSIERSERGSLRGELQKLVSLNQQMSTDANNLTRALRGDIKTQGHWGEFILESILEKSGLRKEEEYTIQSTQYGERGQVLKPDVIVNLPDEKHIIVDSKVSLVAYETYAAAETDQDKEKSARLHIESLKKHIDGLSGKDYHLANKLITPDFVILFMPIEPAFALAFKHKADLFQYAWDKNIAIVSPTTLLATLRTVGALWKQDKQERNAQEIAKRGGMLYDKFVSLISDLEDVGKKLKAATESYDQVVGKVSSGPGNLVRQVEMLKELGAKTQKSLPQKVLENNRDIET
ncbi:MAG: DNA recombination protein RmuC [Pseudobdellovibrionaceae bacterium]